MKIIKMEQIIIDLKPKVIGIPLDECFVCGKGPCTRHHAIPRSIECKRNVTIPLCDEHKDITHPTVKQFYMPKKLRTKIGKLKKLINNLETSIESIKKDIDFSKNKDSQTSVNFGELTTNRF